MTSFPPIVRLAEPKDENEVYALMQEAYREQPIFPLDEGRIRDHIQHATCKQGGVLGVIEGPESLEAYALAVPAQFWYSRAWHLEELSSFVHPRFRKERTGHAKALIEFLKAFTEQMNLPLLMGIMSTQRLDAKIRLYQRQLTMAGAVFVHNTGHVGCVLSEMG